MADIVNIIIGVIALTYFIMISVATKQHFVTDKYPLGMYVISSVSLLGIGAFVGHAFWWGLAFPLTACALVTVAFAIFVWAIAYSQQKKLSLAFSNEMKIDGIITSGPWKFIRHPFYVSYILFWLGCAVGTMHLVSMMVLAGLLFIYVYSAIREEVALANGSFAETYIDYRKNAGFFLPKRASRN